MISLFHHYNISPSTILPLRHCTILPLSCPIPDFYANIPCYLGLYMRYRAWCVGGGGGTCVASSSLQPRTWCYLGVQFNLLAQSPIPGACPAPIPTGDWGSKLRGSSVIRTLQRRLRCVRLPTPVLVKGVIPFSLPQLDSIERARLGLASLAFCPLKEQTAKIISVGRFSVYRACLY